MSLKMFEKMQCAPITTVLKKDDPLIAPPTISFMHCMGPAIRIDGAADAVTRECVVQEYKNTTPANAC